MVASRSSAAATLDHPNICTFMMLARMLIRHSLQCNNVEGQTLFATIKDHPIELQETLDIALQIADALAEANSLGIVHRDIKPRNIMMTDQRRINLG